MQFKHQDLAKDDDTKPAWDRVNLTMGRDMHSWVKGHLKMVFGVEWWQVSERGFVRAEWPTYQPKPSIPTLSSDKETLLQAGRRDDGKRAWDRREQHKHAEY